MFNLYSYSYNPTPPALTQDDLLFMATSPRQSTSAPPQNALIASLPCSTLTKPVVFGYVSGYPLPTVSVLAYAIPSRPTFEKSVADKFVKIIDLLHEIMTANQTTNFQRVPALQQAIMNLNNEAIKYSDYRVQSINGITTTILQQFSRFNGSPVKRACGVGNYCENTAFCTMVCQYVEQAIQPIAVSMGWLNGCGAVDVARIRQIAN